MDAKNIHSVAKELYVNISSSENVMKRIINVLDEMEDNGESPEEMETFLDDEFSALSQMCLRMSKIFHETCETDSE